VVYETKNKKSYIAPPPAQTHTLPQAHKVHAVHQVVKVFGIVCVCVCVLGRDKKWRIAASVGCAVHASANL